MIYLIDFENVHEDGFSALGRLGDRDAVYCFFTKNVAKISMSALAGIRSGQLHFVEADSGKQSLDLALVSYLGYLIGTKTQELYYEIVSNDNGFQKVADFWNRRGNGLRVRLRKTNGENRGKTEQTRTQKAGQPAAEQTAEAAETPALPAEAAEPVQNQPAAPRAAATPKQEAARAETPAEPRKEPDAALLAALEAAGINASTAEFLQAQAEKYRADKNAKQLVYRAVVKKYGQKNGTQIYNSTKKLLLK